MQVHQVHAGWQQIVFPLVIAGIILAFRARRLMQVRPIQPEKLWIVPVLYLAIVGLLFVRAPPSPLGWLIFVAALPIGALAGWQRGKTTRLHVDPDSGKLMQQGSFWTVAVIVVLVAVKMIAQTEGQALHFDVNLIVDGLAAFSLGLFSAQRVEMYLRAKALLQAAHA